MSTDWYTRLVLTVIAAALVAIAVGAHREARSAGPGTAAEEGRYRFVPIPMARISVRFDTQTGEAWTSLLPDLRIWTKIAETPADLIDRPPVAPAPPPAASPAPAEEPAPEAGDAPPPPQP